MGNAWGMFRGGLGRLGEACSFHARPLWGSLGSLGRLGECLGMLRGGLGRLGPLWAPASQPKGCFWSTCLHFHGPASYVASQAHDRLVLYTVGLTRVKRTAWDTLPQRWGGGFGPFRPEDPETDWDDRPSQGCHPNPFRVFLALFGQKSPKRTVDVVDKRYIVEAEQAAE